MKLTKKDTDCFNFGINLIIRSPILPDMLIEDEEYRTHLDTNSCAASSPARTLSEVVVYNY